MSPVMRTFTTIAAGVALTVAGAEARNPVVDPFTVGDVVDAPLFEGGYSIDETLTIGGGDAPDAAQFYEKLGSVLVDADAEGNIYVLDNGNGHVQVFGPDGGHLRTIGAEGQGPGEFQLPNRLSVNASGEVAVFDMGQQRVSIFGADGRLVRDQILSSMVGGMLLTDDGSLLLTHEEGRPAVAELFDPRGETLWQAGVAPPEGAVTDRMVFKVSREVAPRVTLAADGFQIAGEDAYCLVPLSHTGQLGPGVARAFERQKLELPKPKGEGEDGGHRMVFVTKTVESSPAGAGGVGGEETSVEIGDGETQTFDMKDLARMLPEYAADVRGLLGWPDGRIWVITSQGDDDTIVTDEWNADGTYVRRFSLPSYDRFAVGRDGQLYAVAHDDDDFPLVHRLRVSQVN